jgi:hypothetical protein
MRNYRVLDHTADIGIAVSGKSKKELFARTAAAMLDLIIEREPKTVRLHPEYSLSETEGIAGAAPQWKTIGRSPDKFFARSSLSVLRRKMGDGSLPAFRIDQATDRRPIAG